MRAKKKFTWLSIFAVGVMLLGASAGSSAAAGELTLKDLRHSFLGSKQKLLYNYLERLVQLETTIVTSSNPQEAAEVKIEIGRVEKELKKISGGTPPLIPVASAVPTPPPAAPPVRIKRKPQTHVSRIEGLAGAPSFSKNNIYTFHLPDVGKVSTLKFWATGRRSIDTVGYVWLISPDGRRERITKWKEQYFDEPATELSSYEKIEPFIEDISELITMPGDYRIEFEWTGGIDPLVIYRVELIS